MLVASVLLLIVLAYPGFGGTVRWSLGAVIIAGLAAYAWIGVMRVTSEPPLLVPSAGGTRLRTGELASLGAAVHRANGGLPYSQVAVSSRVREAFAQRLAHTAGLSPEDMHDLEHDLERLSAILHDPALADFLFLRSSEYDERYRWVREARDRGGFDSALRDVLDHMEAWR